MRINCWVLALILVSSASDFANASEDYNETYSARFEAMTGHPLTEEGIRAALENFDDNVRPTDAVAVIAVVGEQMFVDLVPLIKDLPNRKPNDVAEEHKWKYEYENFMNNIRTAVARSLILCKDPEAEEYAIRVAMNAFEMNLTPGIRAIRNLKYLESVLGIDVSNELEFLAKREVGEDGADRYQREAVRELYEIRDYLRHKGSSRIEIYNAAIDRCLASMSAVRRQAFEDAYSESRRPRWEATYEFYKPTPPSIPQPKSDQ